MLYWCYILASLLGAVSVLYALLEVHYFLRMLICGVLARYVKKRCHVLDTISVTGICLTTDLDTLLYHMNNARYLRELDFARVDFYERTKLYNTIVSKGGSVVQGATTIRYRRFIRPFTMFKITSRIIYWDNQTIFMEHRFISLKDAFIHCIAICRQRILNCSAEDVMSTLLAKQILPTPSNECPQQQQQPSSEPPQQQSSQHNGDIPSGIDTIENGDVLLKLKPDMPSDIAKWIEYNEISSKNLRNTC